MGSSQSSLTKATDRPGWAAFLLTPVAFVKEFYCAGDPRRANFIKYGYKEAIEEGLKGKYKYGGRKFWAVMMSTLSNQFSGKYPSTDGARTVALKDFKPTKQDLEEAWIVNNANNPQTKLRMRQLAEYLYGLDITFPTVRWVIVLEYAIAPRGLTLNNSHTV